MRFANSWRADKQHVQVLAYEVAGGQFVDGFPLDGRIKLPIEVFQRFELPELRCLSAACQPALVAHVEFVLHEQFQKLGMAEAIGCGFLQAHFQGLS